MGEFLVVPVRAVVIFLLLPWAVLLNLLRSKQLKANRQSWSLLHKYRVASIIYSVLKSKFMMILIPLVH